MKAMRNLLAIMKECRENIYLFGVIVYVISYLLEYSTVSTILPSIILDVAKLISFISLFSATCIAFFSDMPWFIACGAVVCLIAALAVYFNSGATVSVCLVLLCFGSYRLDVARVVRNVGRTITLTSIAILVLAAAGTVPNIYRPDNYGLLKYDLGFGYGSQPGLYLESVLICYLIVRRGCLPKKTAAIFIVLSIIIYALWKFETSLIATILIVICGLLVGRSVNQKNDVPQQGLRYISTAAFPVIGTAFFSLTYLYRAGNPFFDLMNQVLTWRLGLGINAIKQYGVSLFGQRVFFTGFGFDAVNSSVSLDDAGNAVLSNVVANYNYVDSSYVQFPILLGVIFTLMVIAAYSIIAWVSVGQGERVVALIIIVLAIQSCVNPIMIQPYANCIPILLGHYLFALTRSTPPRTAETPIDLRDGVNG